jgi:hypothetical protein
MSKMVRDAALTAKQRLIVSQYFDTILREKINDTDYVTARGIRSLVEI